MNRIVCTGDSHTWGQGASPEAEKQFRPPVVAGDLRPMPLGVKSFVSLLRDEVNRLTGSSARETTAAELIRGYGLEPAENGAAIGERPLAFHAGRGLVRLLFKGRAGESRAAVTLDGRLVETVDLFAAKPGDTYLPVPVFVNEPGGGLIEIKSVEGRVSVYATELYEGDAAVVNAGVGSCGSERYGSEFWPRFVEPCGPDILVIQAPTINDWLTGCTPRACRGKLRELIQKGKAAGARPILVTAAPILGPQALPFNSEPYDRFVEASRLAAAEEGVRVADANAAMNNLLETLPPEVWGSRLFADNWHVNALGHRLYAEAVLPVLKNLLGAS